MISNNLLTLSVFVGILSLVSATGKQGYGDECSITSGITNLFTSDEKDDARGCNADKNLVCTGKCVCIPGYVFEKSGILSLFTGGRCSQAANFPCKSKSDDCVANSACTGDPVSICRCNDGYHSSDGHCTNGSSKNFLNIMYLVTLVASYFLFSK